MTNLERKLVNYANNKIDSACEWEGPNNVIPGLLEFGFTKKELVKMGFDDDVIDNAIEELEDEDED